MSKTHRSISLLLSICVLFGTLVIGLPFTASAAVPAAGTAYRLDEYYRQIAEQTGQTWSPFNPERITSPVRAQESVDGGEWTDMYNINNNPGAWPSIYGADYSCYLGLHGDVFWQEREFRMQAKPDHAVAWTFVAPVDGRYNFGYYHGDALDGIMTIEYTKDFSLRASVDGEVIWPAEGGWKEYAYTLDGQTTQEAAVPSLSVDLKAGQIFRLENVSDGSYLRLSAEMVYLGRNTGAIEPGTTYNPGDYYAEAIAQGGVNFQATEIDSPWRLQNRNATLESGWINSDRHYDSWPIFYTWDGSATGIQFQPELPYYQQQFRLRGVPGYDLGVTFIAPQDGYYRIGSTTEETLFHLETGTAGQVRYTVDDTQIWPADGWGTVANTAALPIPSLEVYLKKNQIVRLEYRCTEAAVCLGSMTATYLGSERLDGWTGTAFTEEGGSISLERLEGDNFVLADRRVTAFTMQADVTLTDGNVAGLVFGAAAPSPDALGGVWGAFQIYGGGVRLFDHVSGVDVIKELELDKSRPIQVKISVDARGNIKAYIDGTLVVAAVLEGYTGGYLGLNSFLTAAKFENILFSENENAGFTTNLTDWPETENWAIDAYGYRGNNVELDDSFAFAQETISAGKSFTFESDVHIETPDGAAGLVFGAPEQNADNGWYGLLIDKKGKRC